MKTTAVILAAGQGTRMKSQLPKVLHQVGGKPMLHWVMAVLTEAQVQRQIVVLGHKGEQVAETIPTAEIAYQRQQLGTGHAVMQAAGALGDEDGCVLVVCGDTPLLRAETIQGLIARHQESANGVTILTAVVEEPFGYGRIVRQGQQVQAIVEEKDADPAQKAIREINAGTYCFDQRFLLRALGQLTTDNAQGEYYLTDVVKLAVAEGLAVDGYILRDAEEIMGINNRVQLAQAEKIMNQRKLRQLMTEGVTIIDPDHTYVDWAVQVGMDTILWPGTILGGVTEIGQGCEIGPDTRITDSRVGDGSRVQNSIIVESIVGRACNIGPFAYLRPGSQLADQVKIGDFVEIKKSTIGQGSKIPHLSYVGDAQVGSGVNIGCGTITCNYDGRHKHQTVIEDDAFIGSNTNLVAPVTVHEGAFIGAGSTITKDVSAESLALTRGELKVKEGWAKGKKG